MSSPEADILTSALEFAVEVAQGKLRAGIVLTPKTVRALTAILPQISQIVLDSMPKPEKKDVEIQTLPCITIPRLDPYANHESAAQREIDPLNLNSVLNDESIFVTPSALPPTSFPIGPPAYLASGPSTLLTASTSTAAGPPTFRSMAREHHWYDRQYDFGQMPDDLDFPTSLSRSSSLRQRGIPAYRSTKARKNYMQRYWGGRKNRREYSG